MLDGLLPKGIQKRLDRKIVIVINGKGGAGKDTVCEITESRYYAKTISSIDPVKDLARRCGWNGEKDNKSRKFLSDLKSLLIAYNDYPNVYLEKEYEKFLQDDAQDILFVHIRENDQIEDFKSRLRTKCITLLIRSQLAGTAGEVYGNDSDDKAEDYPYDYEFTNEPPLEALIPKFLEFLSGLLEKEGIHERGSSAKNN
jgi:hypothetical protein